MKRRIRHRHLHRYLIDTFKPRLNEGYSISLWIRHRHGLVNGFVSDHDTVVATGSRVQQSVPLMINL